MQHLVVLSILKKGVGQLAIIKAILIRLTKKLVALILRRVKVDPAHVKHVLKLVLERISAFVRNNQSVWQFFASE